MEPTPFDIASSTVAPTPFDVASSTTAEVESPAEPTPTAIASSASLAPQSSTYGAKIGATNSKAKRNKQRGHANRSKKRRKDREEVRREPYRARDENLDKFVAHADELKTNYDTSKIPSTLRGFTSLPGKSGRVHTAKELEGKLGFTLVKWDGK
jgi:hypothetical protein